ncbi:sensor histidine kinase KdpD [Cellulomonas sp. Root137]|uniref:sensor histidine kinase n=1 Tax=Cellulomonas sp. Root137 TaxID=1736459 RepID=UPI0006FB27E5|nr:sensor histidine kinase KdpD [Cellulomonas sp. Root137]KQY47940.1 histidine kinase [Cellulomonas sp. Root137]
MIRPDDDGSGADRPRRGRLTVYLGAAPGVGKTYAMLDEAHRRLSRGTDVVVGLVEAHGRLATAALLEGLEVLPRRVLTHRGSEFTELDVEALLARAPQVAMIDELAHTNVPGSLHLKRWQDVHDILDAGIDVVTTVNVQHLESLNDDVEAITGVKQRETVPDHVVRDADQIQLVDLPPEALRRRLAHGNVYRAEQIDASLTQYFRVGNLTALRELALLWLADRVDDALTTYRREHRIESPWPARERVVVAVTGGPEGDTLLRRGARIAQRAAGSELLAVHVLATDGLPSAPPARIAEQRRLVESLGGTFHTVVGEDVPTAVVDFARGVNATMIVVGVSRRSRWREAVRESNGTEIARLAGMIDVHLVTHERARSGRRHLGRTSPLSRPRRVGGWVLALVGPVLLTIALSALQDMVSLPTDLMLFLALTVLVALVGGLWPAIVSAVVGFVLLNWFFTLPTGRLTIAEPENALALGVFVLVAAGVASVVDIAARRTTEAFRARAEASALAAVSRSVLSGEDTAAALVARLRETFTLEAVALLAKNGSRWDVLATDGTDPPLDPETATAVLVVDEERVLTLSGRILPASDRRVLEAFASQVGIVLEQERLRARAEQARILGEADATRTALLAAVSHDLRTPLATIRASVDGLTSTDLHLDEADRTALVGTLEESTARLERLIDNLLDLSRLQTGSVRPVLRATSLDEIVPFAVEGYSPGAVVLDLPDDLPLVHTDPGLLERVVANLVSNAVRHAPADSAVVVSASTVGRGIVVRVVDKGPGIPDELKDHMFDAFQRLGDTTGNGLGLGLAVADGLATAVGAELSVENTPGGGLTMLVTVPLDEAGA